jgi:hypothetical protein
LEVATLIVIFSMTLSRTEASIRPRSRDLQIMPDGFAITKMSAYYDGEPPLERRSNEHTKYSWIYC